MERFSACFDCGISQTQAIRTEHCELMLHNALQIEADSVCGQCKQVIQTGDIAASS